MESFDIWEELMKAVYETGITGLLNKEKAAEKIIEHFKRIGKFDELKRHVKEVENQPIYQLIGEVIVDGSKVPFYRLLEEYEITLDPDNFLRLNNERVAYVGSTIIPLKGKKRELKYVLEKIIELKRELSYPSEVYELPNFTHKGNNLSDEENLIQANKVTYDFGEFPKNVDKPVKKSKDPFVQALIYLDQLPEYDPEEEERQRQIERELAILSDMDKILEERERAYLVEDKLFKVIPRKKLVMNPGPEFFDELSVYASEAFKRLRKERPNDDLLKAIEKEYLKYSGISKKRKLGLLLAALKIASVIAIPTIAVGVYFYYSKLKQKEEMEKRIKPLIDAGLTREKALEFDKVYGEWAPYNKTEVEYAKYWANSPDVSEALLQASGSLNNTVSSLSLVLPYVKNGTLTLSNLKSFIAKYPSLVKDDGINATDLKLIKYYKKTPGVVDKVVEKFKSQEERLFALNELAPYIPSKLSEEQASQLIEKYPELFKISKKMGTSVLFGDPDEDSVNNYDEIFIYGTDPLLGIGNLTWIPTKVVNDKVYDGKIFVKAKALRGISSAKLLWIPKVYPHLPKEAFPNETQREFDLIPLNYTLIKSFVNITDIKGGREYIVSVKVVDKSGSVEVKNLVTPYIREFENIAPLDNVLVGVHYYAWWWSNYKYPPGNWWNYKTNKPAVMHTPLLGFYDSSDTIVFNKHIDWATGHGIDFFLINWVCPSSYPDPLQRKIDLNLKENLLKNTYLLNREDIKFAITFDPLINREMGRYKSDNGKIDLRNPQNRELLFKDFKYFSQYFSHPAYLKINGKPVVYVVVAELFIPEDLKVEKAKETFLQIQDELGIYLIGELGLIHNLPSEESPYVKAKIEFIPAFNAITTYFPFGALPQQQTLEYLETNYYEWSNFARKNSLSFIPVASPGFDNTNRIAPEKPSCVKPRDLNYFSGALKTCIDYLDPKLRMLVITSFNEWYEDTMIEPGKDYGFTYLKALKRVLQNIVYDRP